MSENLEYALIYVNRYINIDRDREAYMAHFVHFRTQLFEKLRENPVLKYLLNGLQLQGSYGDNLKVQMPDEYDLVFNLKLPEPNSIIVEKDQQNPGFIRLNLSEVFKKIEKQEHHFKTLKVLRDCSTNNFLHVVKLQSWLQSQFDRALLALQNKICFNGESSTLKYRRQGPAHTVTVKGAYNYSVDFVPAILLTAAQSISPLIKCNWEAILKPLKNECSARENSLLRISCYQNEYNLIKDKKNLKNALRIMKKFRDSHPNMANLKSYYIKTIFLWRASKEKESYWQQSLGTVIIDMFNDLHDCLIKKKLKFYWDERNNLLQLLTPSEISEMVKCVQSAKATLEKAAPSLIKDNKNKVLSLFLTKSEMKNEIGKQMGTTTTTVKAGSIIETKKNESNSVPMKLETKTTTVKAGPIIETKKNESNSVPMIKGTKTTTVKAGPIVETKKNESNSVPMKLETKTTTVKAGLTIETKKNESNSVPMIKGTKTTTVKAGSTIETKKNESNSVPMIKGTKTTTVKAGPTIETKKNESNSVPMKLETKTTTVKAGPTIETKKNESNSVPMIKGTKTTTVKAEFIIETKQNESKCFIQ